MCSHCQWDFTPHPAERRDAWGLCVPERRGRKVNSTPQILYFLCDESASSVCNSTARHIQIKHQHVLLGEPLVSRAWITDLLGLPVYAPHSGKDLSHSTLPVCGQGPGTDHKMERRNWENMQSLFQVYAWAVQMFVPQGDCIPARMHFLSPCCHTGMSIF